MLLWPKCKYLQFYHSMQPNMTFLILFKKSFLADGQSAHNLSSDLTLNILNLIPETINFSFIMINHLMQSNRTATVIESIIN